MFEIKKTTTIFRPLLNGFLLIFLLSGCQHFPALFQDEAKSPPLSSFKDDGIPTHEFSRSGKQTIVGQLATLYSEENDSLPDIARHFGLGFGDISIANPALSPWEKMPKPGSKVLLPCVLYYRMRRIKILY